MAAITEWKNNNQRDCIILCIVHIWIKVSQFQLNIFSSGEDSHGKRSLTGFKQQFQFPMWKCHLFLHDQQMGPQLSDSLRVKTSRKFITSDVITNVFVHILPLVSTAFSVGISPWTQGNIKIMAQWRKNEKRIKSSYLHACVLIFSACVVLSGILSEHQWSTVSNDFTSLIKLGYYKCRKCSAFVISLLL